MRAAALTVCGLLLLAPPAAAQDFKWHGALANGKTLEVRGVSGDIRASRATGGEAEVTAEKRGRKSDPDDVEIRVIEHEDGVTICAVYPSRRGRSNSCEAGRSNQDTDNNDVEVKFTVKVPAGVEFDGVTVNGDIIATDLPDDAEVSTVNGDIEVTAAGSVEATTVNGSIEATMGRATWNGELEFTTVNGGIRVTMPSGVNADVRANTVNGSVDSDFEITMQGRMRRGAVQGRIGKGGADLELSTVNGSIELRKAR
jgi:DUF4097 and DUF4098 domain-containing protein YvlB